MDQFTRRIIGFGVDIYKDDNALNKQHEWYRGPTANIRDTFGEVQLTVQQKLQFECVNGTKGRSGHQMDIWGAVFGPVGKDGFFEPLIDPMTGAINHGVAAYWKAQNDLLNYKQTNWSTLGSKIPDKLRIYTGDMDTFQLDKAVVLMSVGRGRPRIRGNVA